MWLRSKHSPVVVQNGRSISERSLVRRLDMFLLTFGCVSQVIKFLDQTNINNAYISGMKEDLKLYGNELNYFTTYFNVGYCVMLIPSQVILTYVRPSFWLSGLEITWGILTGLMAMTTNARQVYAIRVFVGLCESSAWPGMMTLLMHWYTPLELAKRMGFYQSCQAIGGMMSGAIQAAISSTLHGRGGLAGWRWLFIINAIMTITCGCLGLIMLPDYPNRPNPRAIWFTKQHAELALERLVRHGRAEPKSVSLAGVKRTFTSWATLLVPALYCCTVVGNYGYTFFGLFLKSLKNPDGSKTWTVAQVNAIPIGGSAIQVMFVWIWAFLSDFFQVRWQLIVTQTVLGLIPAITMSVWTSEPNKISLKAAYAGYFMNYVVLGTAPLLFSWLADIIPYDPEARALIVGTSITADYAIAAWSYPLTWPAREAPYYRYGWECSIALLTLGSVLTLLLRLLDARYFRKIREDFAAALERQTVSNDEGVKQQQGVASDARENIDQKTTVVAEVEDARSRRLN